MLVMKKWYLYFLDEAIGNTGLSEFTFVSGFAEPVQTVREHFLIKTARKFDVIQPRLFWTLLLEPPSNVLILFHQLCLLDFPLTTSMSVLSYHLELSDS